MKTIELNKLPKSWDEITLDQFQKLSKIEIKDGEFAGIENTISVIGILTETPVEDLETLSMKELMMLGDRIRFISTKPEPSKKTSLTKWKDLESITYNDYIVYVQNQNDILTSLDEFVKQFSKSELSKEEVLQLPITDVLQGFFLYRKKLRQSMKLLEWLTKLEVKRLLKKERQALKKK